MPKSKTKKEAPVEPPTEEDQDAVMNEPPTSHQPALPDTNEDDVSMADPAAENVEDEGQGQGEQEEEGEEEEEEEEEEEPQRIRLLPGSTPTAASFEFLGEGHTLGNALRYVIMKNPDVEFCAYAIPHPSEDKMNIRIQTYGDGSTAIHALEKGLKDIQELCDVVTDKFIEARDEFHDMMT